MIKNGVKEYEDKYEFKAGNISFDISKLMALPKREIQAFNQDEHDETIMACTIVNAYRQWCHRVGKLFTDSEMIDVVYFCVTQGYVIGDGRGTTQAMEAVNKYVNLTFPDYKSAYISIEHDDPNIVQILLKNHTLGFAYRGNADWDRDREDGVLSGVLYSPCSYGHRTIMKNKGGFCVDDSFRIKEYIIENFGKLVDNGINIYPTFYLRLVDSNLDTETIKKYTKWKILLEQNISNNNVMLNDARRKTVDESFRKSLVKDNELLQKKLAFVLGELKKNGN